MENKIILFGANGHCKVIIDILQKCDMKINMIVDDNSFITSVLDYVVVNSKNVKFSELDNLIITIGNNLARKRISGKMDCNFVCAIHPKAIISEFVKMGKGTVVMAGAILNVDVLLGEHCIINTGSVVDHDCIIGDYVHISPNATLAGGVVIGEGTHVGIGASIIQGIKIGKWVTIGAGSVILRDIPDFAVVVGVPGNIIKYNSYDD